MSESISRKRTFSKIQYYFLSCRISCSQKPLLRLIAFNLSSKAHKVQTIFWIDRVLIFIDRFTGMRREILAKLSWSELKCILKTLKLSDQSPTWGTYSSQIKNHIIWKNEWKAKYIKQNSDFNLFLSVRNILLGIKFAEEKEKGMFHAVSSAESWRRTTKLGSVFVSPSLSKPIN